MSLIVYINGQLVPTDIKTKISQTKQVNDIGSVNDRQANYASITLPITAQTKRVLRHLGSMGVVNRLPYQRNTCDIFDGDTGEALIYKGWLIIKETNTKYSITVYDGVIDFYKAIENKLLSDLNISSLAHTRTLANVVESWNNITNYKYILADYNGKSLYAPGKINIDSLIPSVRVSWLLQQLFSFIGFTYSGSFLTDPKFTNLYMSYPKGDSNETKLNICESSSMSDTSYLLLIDSTNIVSEITIGVGGAYGASPTTFTVLKDGMFEINIAVSQGGYLTFVYPRMNGEMMSDGEFSLSTFKTIKRLYAGDVLTFDLDLENGTGTFNHLKIERYNSLTIDFIKEFAGFGCKDFINEIMQRFGLTMFKDKYSNHCTFKTLKEIISNPLIEDWTSKFKKWNSDNYINGDYAQKSWMRYKYNEKDVIYNDASINIDNVNLKDASTIIQSSVYCPERIYSNVLGFQSPVFKLWDKEVADDVTVKYKPLDNRFYFMRENVKTFDTALTIGNSIAEQTFTTAPVATFQNLDFETIINDNYNVLKLLLNNSLLTNAEFNLKASDISNIDFSKPKFIEQLAGYFLLNKVGNYVKGKLTKCELIKIQYK